MSKSNGWGGSQVTRARSAMKPMVDSGEAVCFRCGLPIRPGATWHLDHKVRLSDGGDANDPSNWAASHARCNTRDGALTRHAKSAESREPLKIEKVRRPKFVAKVEDDEVFLDEKITPALCHSVSLPGAGDAL